MLEIFGFEWITYVGYITVLLLQLVLLEVIIIQRVRD